MTNSDISADPLGIEANRRTEARRALLREARQILRTGGDRAAAGALVAQAEQIVASACSEAERADGAHGLASFFVEVGDDAAAEPYARQAIASEREAGRQVFLGNHLMFLSQLLVRQGHLEEATTCAEEGSGLYDLVYGAEHSEARYMQSVLARLKQRG